MHLILRQNFSIFGKMSHLHPEKTIVICMWQNEHTQKLFMRERYLLIHLINQFNCISVLFSILNKISKLGICVSIFLMFKLFLRCVIPILLLRDYSVAINSHLAV